MSRYRRLYVPGGTYFFTVVTAGRQPWLSTIAGNAAFHASLAGVRRDLPFSNLAMVVLPDHLHCIWKLPEGDARFPDRWKRLKQRCTHRLKKSGFGNGPFWQARYWEHCIRDRDDLDRHMDYIHFNPVRHGFVESPRDWADSSFHDFVARGWYAPDWAGPGEELDIME